MSGLKLLASYSSDEESAENESSFCGRNVINSKILPAQSASEAVSTSDIVRELLVPKEEESDSLEWKPLPLPSCVKSMFEGTGQPEGEDNPDDHCGRIRAFPHERGMWATFVYIEYTPEPEFYELVEKFAEISRSHGVVLVPSEEFHISLSRTVRLRYHWIPTFVSALNAHLRHFCSFKVMLQSTEVYSNEEKTRTFVGLKVHVGFDSLLKITQKVDKSLEEFKLPSFYTNPSFHLSCASCVGDKVQDVELFMADLNVAFQSFVDSHPECRSLWVKSVYCKSGNKLFCIPLKS